MGRSNAFNLQGDKEKAIADLSEAIRLKPNYADAYNNRGTFYAQLGDLDKAISDFTIAINLKPDFAAAFRNRGNAYQEKGDLDNAIMDYQEALRHEPDNGVVRSSLMSILRSTGKLAEAHEQEKLARELIHKESEYNQACFEALCGNTEKALELLRIGLEKKQVTNEWAQKDPDFESIRDDPRFKKLVSG